MYIFTYLLVTAEILSQFTPSKSIIEHTLVLCVLVECYKFQQDVLADNFDLKKMFDYAL